MTCTFLSPSQLKAVGSGGGAGGGGSAFLPLAGAGGGGGGSAAACTAARCMRGQYSAWTCAATPYKAAVHMLCIAHERPAGLAWGDTQHAQQAHASLRLSVTGAGGLSSDFLPFAVQLVVVGATVQQHALQPGACAVHV